MTLLNTLYCKVLLPPVKALTKDDAETAHNAFVRSMTFASKHPRLRKAAGSGPIEHPRLSQTLMDGLHFPNPFGTAAGMDKNATIYPALIALTGVGHVEVGAVTLRPQPGNERPRPVRVDRQHLINAMGFPNDGVDVVAERLSGSVLPPVPLGFQIAKNKDTDDADVAAEYAATVHRLASLPTKRVLPDYFTINVSSPNTPGLQAHQAPEMLEGILEAVTAALDEQARSRRRLLIKLAPDIDTALIDDIVGLVLKFGTGGLVIGNTTKTRPVHSRFDDRAGGFSGPAIYELAAPLIRYAASKLPLDRVLVACGGINSLDRAYEMLRYADLIDAYTALVLEGPHLFRDLAAGVTSRLEAEGVSDLRALRAPNRAQA